MKRRKQKQLQKWKHGKQVRRLEVERRVLHMAIFNAELIPLEQPYQRGWRRWFDWSESARRRPDFETLSGVLELLWVEQWSPFPDFRPLRRHRKRKWPRWSPRLCRTPKDLLRECKDSRLLKYFETSRFQIVHGEDHLRQLIRIGWGGQVRFRHPHLLISHVEPYMITHQRVVKPEAEARLAEIEQWMDARGGWRMVNHHFGSRSWKEGDPRAKRIRKIETREVREELEGRGYLRAFRLWWVHKQGLAIGSFAG